VEPNGEVRKRQRINDMSATRNPQRGSARWNAKLTDDDVRLIRELVAERERLLTEARKLTDEAIAAKFEVHPHTVWKVTKRDSWAHV
jgi:hypothetical protein